MTVRNGVPSHRAAIISNFWNVLIGINAPANPIGTMLQAVVVAAAGEAWRERHRDQMVKVDQRARGPI
jgi:hypothetical protein